MFILYMFIMDIKMEIDVMEIIVDKDARLQFREVLLVG